MRQPPGYEERGKEDKVCFLRRSIYGLKQSARCWNLTLSNVVEKLDFKASQADPCLFVRSDVFLIVLLRKLCSLKLPENGNLPAHLKEMVKLYTRLQAVDEGLKDRVFMALILSSLPQSYDSLIVSLENRP